MLSRLATTSGNSRKSDGIVSARIVRKHERYCTLYELPLSENIINDIYGFAYRCRDCQKRQFNEESIEGIISRNNLHEHGVDRLIFSIKHNFPNYDWVRNSVFKILSKRRYERLRWVYADWMTIKILIFVVR